MVAEALTSGFLELWGGAECTVNRVGDSYYDQLEASAHSERLDDLDLFAALGLRKLRYPVLWERTAPEGPGRADWSWADERLNMLRDLNIEPIVGLVHHGSGPAHTSLDQSSFAAGLAEYGRAVAERYPWVRYYTPVNEPLTTARFSGLYGHWYPHGTDARMFVRCLLSQVKGVALSMRAIREVNPDAQLVQTDDLGKTHSTPTLAYQAQFENERRWVTWDLLCGRVDRHHTMWRYLRWAGADAADLHWLLDNPCPPDIIGVNHYLTSERYLDHRLERYPASAHGGNGRHVYADVEAVRVMADGPAGPEALLEEAWRRYHIPVAVTEAHLGCTREEQMRWLLEIWDGALALRRRGADIRAVTVWSLLGAHDWNSLLTRFDGFYEPGVFDIRGGRRRPTALAHLARELGHGLEPRHPALAVPGWWRRPERLLYPAVGSVRAAARKPSGRFVHAKDAARPLVITGAGGMLGRGFARICEQRGLPYQLLDLQEMDIADPAQVRAVLEQAEPWAVIDAAGSTLCEKPEADCGGTALLAAMCAENRVGMLTFTSDRVFHAERETPFVESDEVCPACIFGMAEAEKERRVCEAMPGALVVRTSTVFSPWDEENAVTRALTRLAAGKTVEAAADVALSPTYVPDLAQASLDLLLDGEEGIRHLCNDGTVSEAELIARAARAANIPAATLQLTILSERASLVPGARFRALGTERGQLMPNLDDAIARYIRDCVCGWAADRAADMPFRVRERLTAEGLRGETSGSPARAHAAPRKREGRSSRAEKCAA
jgi:dTDP-4-dehydrorhamnose reductase